MDKSLLYSINIAMEASIILVLLVLLVTLVWQKKVVLTTVPLTFLTCLLICMLFTQIGVWGLMLIDAPMKYGVMPLRIVNVLDYFFSYSASCAFYYYVEALAIDDYKNIGIYYKPPKHVKRMIIFWGIATTLLYAGLLFIPSLYRMEGGVITYSIPAYIVLTIMAKFACICALVLLIRHRKVIGKHDVVLSVIFLVLISALVIVDELYEVCIGYVIMSIWVMILYVRIDLQKGMLLEKKERENIEWKTQIMLSQMQPHFLYNVLTTISSMCETQNAIEARDVVNRFADYFRANLDSLGKEKTIPFEKELEHIKTYLWLEKIRFEDDLNINYEIGPADFAVPSLTTQPIVENAVKHGIVPKEEAGTVTIRTSETEQDYVIIVEDDGVGFDVNKKPDDNRTHIGIENVKKRLEIICNGTCEIDSQEGKGTIVTIHIPKGEWK